MHMGLSNEEFQVAYQHRQRRDKLPSPTCQTSDSSLAVRTPPPSPLLVTCLCDSGEAKLSVTITLATVSVKEGSGCHSTRKVGSALEEQRSDSHCCSLHENRGRGGRRERGEKRGWLLNSLCSTLTQYLTCGTGNFDPHS